MIKVVFFIKQNQITGFEISGHAGYDDLGRDILCASVSALSINTLNAIDAFTDDSMDYSMGEDGFLKAHLPEVSEKSDLLLNSLKLGILGIEQEYGHKYIKVLFEEV